MDSGNDLADFLVNSSIEHCDNRVLGIIKRARGMFYSVFFYNYFEETSMKDLVKGGSNASLM